MVLTIAEVSANPIVQALNPAGKDFMQVRRISARLSPCGQQIAALIPFGIFPHIKTIAAYKMMMSDFLAGRYDGKHTIVVDSSGNTAHAVARLAPAFGFKHIKVVLSLDVPESKRGILNALSSVEIIEVPSGVAERAREEGARLGHYHLNQYGHWGNLEAHYLFTGPASMRALNMQIACVAIAMGSGGTAAGVGKYFQQSSPQTVIIGVRPKLGEQVSGARDRRRMEEVVTLPWQNYVHEVVDVSRKEAFIAMRQLWSEVEPQPGPTSGLAYAGLLAYLKDSKGARSHPGIAAFICPDDGRFYSERTTGELDPDQGVL